jgi:hypothetical protein
MRRNGFPWTKRLGSESLAGMDIDKLKSEIEKYRDKLNDKKGKVCTFGKNGPVSLGLIDAIVETLEAQHQRIEALEKKAGS